MREIVVCCLLLKVGDPPKSICGRLNVWEDGSGIMNVWGENKGSGVSLPFCINSKGYVEHCNNAETDKAGGMGKGGTRAHFSVTLLVVGHSKIEGLLRGVLSIILVDLMDSC